VAGVAIAVELTLVAATRLLVPQGIRRSAVRPGRRTARRPSDMTPALSDSLPGPIAP
jgi:hypothetical protein